MSVKINALPGLHWLLESYLSTRSQYLLLSAKRQISQSRCGCPTAIMLNRFPLFSILCNCNNFRPEKEMERLHVHHNLVPPLFLSSISRALPVTGWSSGSSFFRRWFLSVLQMCPNWQSFLLNHVWYLTWWGLSSWKSHSLAVKCVLSLHISLSTNFVL